MRIKTVYNILLFWGSMLFSLVVSGQEPLETVYLEEVTVASDTIPEENYLLTVDDYMTQRNDLQVVKRGNFAYEPIVEGFTDGQIAVVIDGMRVFSACTDKMDPATSYLEPVNLQKLTVLKENESQIYGTALGGTVTAEMKYPDQTDDIKVGVQTAYSSNTNGFDGNLFVDKKINEKWGLRYSGAYRKHNSYTDGNDQLVKYTQFEKMNHTLTTTYKLSNTQEFSGLFMYDHGKDIGYPALNMDVSSAKALMGNIGYKQHFESSFIHHLEAKIYYNDIKHVMDDTKRENVAMHMDMPGESQTFGTWVALHHNSQSHKTTFKVDFYANRLFADMMMYSPTGGINMYMITWGDIQRNSFSTTLQDNWQLHDRLSLLTNVRLEYAGTNLQNELARKQFETLNYFIDAPRNDISGSFTAQFKYDLTENIEARFGGGYVSRMPTASELYGFYLFNANDRYDYVGTPDLKNEKSTSFDFSMRYHNEEWEIGLRGKKSFISDYIVGVVDDNYDAMTPGALGVKRYQNISSATSSHLELFTKIYLIPNTQYSLFLVYENGYVDELHSPMPYQRPLTIKQKVDYQFHKLTTSLYYEYCNGMQSPSSILGEQKTDAYHLINLDFSYPIQLKNNNQMFIGMGIHNLTNTYYVDPFAWNSIPNMGRNIKVNLRFIL